MVIPKIEDILYIVLWQKESNDTYLLFCIPWKQHVLIVVHRRVEDTCVINGSLRIIWSTGIEINKSQLHFIMKQSMAEAKISGVPQENDFFSLALSLSLFFCSSPERLHIFNLSIIFLSVFCGRYPRE